jgi:hypothetical protein
MQQEEFADRIAGYIAYPILIILQIPLSCLSPFEPLSFYLDIGYSILGVGYSSAVLSLASGICPPSSALRSFSEAGSVFFHLCPLYAISLSVPRGTFLKKVLLMLQKIQRKLRQIDYQQLLELKIYPQPLLNKD